MRAGHPPEDLEVVVEAHEWTERANSDRSTPIVETEVDHAEAALPDAGKEAVRP
jgi:hypothetical protein